MKMKHFIPALALAMLCTIPAFAVDPTPGEVQPSEMNTPLDFTVGDFFRIHRGAETYHANAQLLSNDYSTLDLNNPLQAQYIVYTNKAASEKLTLKGVVDSSGTDEDALYGTDKDDLWLIFGNTTNLPTDASIQACRAPAAAKNGSDNPNAIVLKLTPTISKQENSGDGSAIAMTDDYSTDYRVKYTFNNGIYTFTYVTATEAKAKTFSTADTAGTYKATLYVTRNGA